jgi:hypothetical protein
MRRWLFLLGGLIVWATHFTGVYALGSLAAIRDPAEDGAWRAVLLAFSVVCAGAAAMLAVRAAMLSAAGDAPHRFKGRVAAMGAALSLVAIVWQTLPALLS